MKKMMTNKDSPKTMLSCNSDQQMGIAKNFTVNVYTCRKRHYYRIIKSENTLIKKLK